MNACDFVVALVVVVIVVVVVVVIKAAVTKQIPNDTLVNAGNRTTGNKLTLNARIISLIFTPCRTSSTHCDLNKK